MLAEKTPKQMPAPRKGGGNWAVRPGELGNSFHVFALIGVIPTLTAKSRSVSMKPQYESIDEWTTHFPSDEN